jgi:hypothetical protein
VNILKKGLSTFLVSALGATCLVVVAGGTSADAATSPKSLVTCQNTKTGVHRVLTKGSCIPATEKKVSWKKIASATAGSIALCTNTKTGVSRILGKGSCLTKTEVKSFWKKTASSVSPIVLTCAEGGKCATKETGPGGGMVFYVADSPQSWGQYLEVAPKTWQSGGDPTAPWCSVADTNIITAYEIGDGFANTAALAAACALTAAKLAMSYRGGGKSDWYVPSYKEIKELHGYVYGHDISGFAPDFYWSSSQDGVTTGWAESFGNQGSVVAIKATLYLVRPIRRF